MGNIIEAFVAFDTSKLRNAVAIAEAGRAGVVRFLGEIENTEAATAKLVRKLAAKYGRLTFCYEAGPTGYGLYRQIKNLGHECMVVAPSLILKKPGERVKTNRRDAVGLAKQLRGGDLTAVWVPDPHHEAMRDLTRAREVAVEDLRCKRQQVSAFLLRQGRRYPGERAWTRAHRDWLVSQKLEYAEHRICMAGGGTRAAAGAAGCRVLSTSSSPDEANAPLLGPGLQAAGLVEGRDVEYHPADGVFDRLPAMSLDLVRRKVAVIYTSLAPATFAAKAATTTIAIVFAIGGDPVEQGIVTSTNRPEGNVTGVTFYTAELGPKRFELLRSWPEGSHETTGIHRDCWWCRRVAVRNARPTRHFAGDWLAERKIAGRGGICSPGVSPRSGPSRLFRRQERHDRISLGGRSV
jgi:hypothetical protein